MRKLILLIIVLILVLGAVNYSRNNDKSLQKFLPEKVSEMQGPDEKIKVVSEESITTGIVKKAGPSVVTVTETYTKTRRVNPFFDLPDSPFYGFSFPDQQELQPQQTQQSIGSGFIVSSDGLVVTNRHVVSDNDVEYQIITSNDKKYKVLKIYRDPLNDVAILKIDRTENSGNKLVPVVLGDSDKLQVGQYVAAIGTALGEFRNTVTTGIISGLGRGINAGSPFEGSVERLDNVIQTDAAINPGNSGGPLLNSTGQVIGVNTAVSQSGQNIGFAIPIKIVKDSLDNFNKTGQFNRPYLGVSYKMISRDLAILNNLPEGAYVQEVVSGSAAEKGGIENGDIIIKINDQRVDANNQLAGIIGKSKVGDLLKIEVFRDGKKVSVQVELDSSEK